MDHFNNQSLLKGKKGLILGVANNFSIAWHISQMAHLNGAELAFTFQNEVLKKRVYPLATSVNSPIILECNISQTDSIKNLVNKVSDEWGKLDFIVHAIAYADKNELRGRFINTSFDNFSNSMHISCYSLIELARESEKLLVDGGSILTLTYHGSTQVMPSYNVMGVAKAALEASVKYLAADLGSNNIRVNAISAGPIKTLAASGIGQFNDMLTIHKNSSPLNRNMTGSDIAKSAIYFLSDLSSGVTGEIHYVDSGYNIMGTHTQ